MRKVNAFFAVLATCVSPLFAAQASEPKNCQLKMFDSIDLLVEDDVFVPVTLNGREGWMALHLASGLSGVSADVMAATGLLKQRSGDGDLAQFRSLSIGKVNFGKGVFLAVGSYKVAAIHSRPVLGWLGTEVFRNIDFELDLARKKLNLFSQDHCPGNVVYWAKDWGTAPLYLGKHGSLYFSVELEDKKIEATFSPTSRTTFLSTDLTKRVYGFDKDSDGIEKGISEDSKAQAYFRAMQLTAPGMAISNTRVQLIENPTRRLGSAGCELTLRGRKSGGWGYADCENLYPMSLGRNVIEKLRLYFATKEKIVYFTLADGSVTEPAPATPGNP